MASTGLRGAKSARNSWAHQTEDSSDEDTYSWLVDIWHLCLETDSDPDHEAADKVHELMDKVLRGDSAAAAQKTVVEEVPESKAEDLPAVEVPAGEPPAEGLSTVPSDIYEGQQAGLPRNWGEPDANGFYPYLQVDPEHFDTPEDFVREILRQEIPVSREFIVSRVRAYFFPDHGKSGYQEQSVVDRAYSSSEFRDYEERSYEYDGKTFRYLYNKNEQLKGPRYKDESSRPIDRIPPDELEEGVYRVLRKKSEGISREDLIEETFYAFGYQRLSQAS